MTGWLDAWAIAALAVAAGLPAGVRTVSLLRPGLRRFESHRAPGDPRD